MIGNQVLTQSNAVGIQFYFKSIKVHEGDDVPLSPNCLTLIIGPNSSGKSTLMREMVEYVQTQSGGVVLDGIEHDKIGTEEEFKEWLLDNFPSSTQNPSRPSEISVFTKGNQAPLQAASAAWAKEKFAPFASFLCHRLDTKQRLNEAGSKQATSINSAPSEYIHLLQRDEAKFDRISSQVRSMFGKDLIVNWGGGQQVWFHVGDEPARTDAHDRVSSSYLRELQGVPLLEDEGDGVRSFVGCLLGIHCGAQKVIFVDEPDAFLHPFQAQRLGSHLAETAANNHQQVFSATHSPELVIGAIESGVDVSICRITRSANKNCLRTLDPVAIKELWSTPFLRSSNAIVGLFHSAVIVCESESDCRFYSAILRQLESKDSGSVRSDGGDDVLYSSAPTDCTFVSSNGKGGAARLAAAYRRVGVQTHIITDFDLLLDVGTFSSLVDAMGGTPSKYSRSVKDLEAYKNSPSDGDQKETFSAHLARAKSNVEATGSLGAGDERNLRSMLRKGNRSSQLKRLGVEELKGGLRQSTKELLRLLREIGLHVVPIGELESWWRDGPGDKNSWSEKVMEEVFKEAESLQGARDFVAEIRFD